MLRRFSCGMKQTSGMFGGVQDWRRYQVFDFTGVALLDGFSI